MSRRITIATKMDNADIVRASLQELAAKFTEQGAVFTISQHDKHKFLYNGCGVDTATGQGFYDSDDVQGQAFVNHTLFQTYNKNLALENQRLSGQFIEAEGVATASTYFPNVYDLEEGDMYILTTVPL